VAEKMLKIALLRNSPRGSKVMLGAERIILAIAEGLDRTRFEPLIVVFSEEGDTEPPLSVRANEKGIPVLPLKLKGRFDTGSISALRNILLENNINIVHSNEYKSDLIGYLASRKARIKTISTAHGFIGTDPKIRIYEFIDVEILKRLDAVVAVSDTMKKTLVSKGVPAGKVVTIENSVDLAPIDPEEGKKVRRELGIPETGILIACAGRLSPERGLEFFMEAMAMAIKDNGNIYVIIAGDGPLKKLLEALSKNFGISERTRFLGFRDDIERILCATDVFISSSLKDSFGMATVEAMASARPVISTDTGIASQIINGRNGILVSQKDPVAIYKAVISLAADPHLREEMGKLARETVSLKFLKKAMINGYERAYSELTGN
jgi:glycosyltransferase involved in cell wall biosynthesis